LESSTPEASIGLESCAQEASIGLESCAQEASIGSESSAPGALDWRAEPETLAPIYRSDISS
jgi:hypothetical protein